MVNNNNMLTPQDQELNPSSVGSGEDSTSQPLQQPQSQQSQLQQQQLQQYMQAYYAQYAQYAQYMQQQQQLQQMQLQLQQQFQQQNPLATTEMVTYYVDGVPTTEIISENSESLPPIMEGGFLRSQSPIRPDSNLTESFHRIDRPHSSEGMLNFSVECIFYLLCFFFLFL